MPLTAKGREILAAMKEEYGDEKGERVFYASKEAGKITGVDSDEGSTVDSLAALNARNRAIHPGGDWSADLARVRSWMATDEGFTAGMIEQLRAEFSKIKNVDPSSPTYQKMHALVERLSPEQLKQLARAGVPFVSNMARGALLRRGIVGDAGDARIVYNKMLGGWFIVRGPNQTPIGGRFDSKEAAQAHLGSEGGLWPIGITRGYDYRITSQQKVVGGVVWKKYEATVAGGRVLSIIWRSERGDIEEAHAP